MNFIKPVHIGETLRLVSKIVYTYDKTIRVLVKAEDITKKT